MRSIDAIRLPAWLALVAFAVPALGAPQPSAAPAPAPAISVSRTRDADDLGRFLGGLPGKPGSPFTELEATEAWQEHARQSDKAWTTYAHDRLPALSGFSRAELSDLDKPPTTLFYPFSGPDALTAIAFFPHVATYVLVALEPPGSITGQSKFLKKDLVGELGQLRATFDSLLRRSFFVTRQMDHQLRGQVTDGVLPLVLVELVRTGNSVLGCEFFWVDENSRVLTRPAEQKTHDWGFALDFRNDSDGSVHRLAYFSVNLASSHLDKNPEFQKQMFALGPVVTYLKSTSYLVHQPEFSLIRDRILGMSAAVLQDDSGVPYKLFTPDKWNVQLFGEYQQPYGSFRYMVEPELKAAFQKPENVKRLDFRIGYGYGRAPSNLELARRK
jgi:hypothetical protein